MEIDCSFGLGYLPIMWTVFTILAFAASYCIAVLEKHVYPVLPSISDTGARIPEANAFSLLMNISIILGLANYFTRYFQCQHQARHCGDNREKIFKYNHLSLLTALTSVFGALIVANVQSRKEFYLSEIHDIGAVIFFIFTCMYLWLQTHITYKVALYGLYSMWLCHFRLFMSLLFTISAATYFITSAISYQYFESSRHHNIAHWMPSDGGYTLHVISNGSEWFCVVIILLFAITYFDEFQQVMLLIDCQEKSPHIISYDGIGDYACVKMSSMDSLNEDNNN
ncbi:DNA damage-regulated autophagy modulator protein 1-like [Hydractinia symbiolongicarpus]|uniref:DNA damage-regulated autophagy modulator protein 1-like n=1 Tax=Hydractinia symbiolongicarpus TaxID=13093 RepID=UPI00254E73BF|nr:DNA damage-regulated autophagy modulator protein 1-like [Hydractinia symbiolongicarpus]